MQVEFTIIYAFRNREADRVQLSLMSLEQQQLQNFKVLFIDYGSEPTYSEAVKDIVEQFSFATYHYVAHEGLLWNKSKAINYGIKLTKTPYIITADVDVLFVPHFAETVVKHIEPHGFLLFKIGYLSKLETKRQLSALNFTSITTTHVGDTFGIGLFSKLALETVGGLDEFFHFYGSEDEDLNVRLQAAGFKLNRCHEVMLYHQWHRRYPQKKEVLLQVQPRLTNVLRINQRQFLWHTYHKITHPNPKSWGHCYDKVDIKTLERPEVVIQLDNIMAHVDHCFGEVLKRYSKTIVQVIVNEAPYFKSLKYRIKKFLGKETQPYMTMKAVNDLILKAIVFHYRDMNYSYTISTDLKQICFTIDFNTDTYEKS